MPGRDTETIKALQQLEMGQVGHLKTAKPGSVELTQGIAIQRQVTVEDHEGKLPDHTFL